MTLAELLIVTAILGTLLALTLPAIQRVRGAADLTRCQEKLRQIGVALHLFHHDYGIFPVPEVRFHSDHHPYNNPEVPKFTPLSWRVALLPYLDQSPLYQATVIAARQEPMPFIVPPHIGNLTVVPAFICPTDPRLSTTCVDVYGREAALCSYLGVSWGLDRRGFFAQPNLRLADIHDGPSYTLAVGERPPPDTFTAGHWYWAGIYGGWPEHFEYGPSGSLWIERTPMSPSLDHYFRFGPGNTRDPMHRNHFWSLHPGGGPFLFVGGNVRFMPYSAQPIMAALASIAGGEPIPDLD